MSGSVTKRFNSEQAAKEWLRNHSYCYLSGNFMTGEKWKLYDYENLIGYLNQTWNGSKFTWELKIVSENG